MLESYTEDGVFITKQAALAAVGPINCLRVFLRTPGFDGESWKSSMMFHNRVELFCQSETKAFQNPSQQGTLSLDQVKKTVKNKKALRYTGCTSTMK